MYLLCCSHQNSTHLNIEATCVTCHVYMSCLLMYTVYSDYVVFYCKQLHRTKLCLTVNLSAINLSTV